MSVDTPLNEQDYILINAYLDDEMTAAERQSFEARLDENPDLRAEVNAFEYTIQIVRMAERVPVPHNFTLDPAVYGKQHSSGILGWLDMRQLFPLATAGAAAAAVIIFGLLLFVQSFGPTGAAAPVAEEAASMEREIQPFAAELDQDDAGEAAAQLAPPHDEEEVEEEMMLEAAEDAPAEEGEMQEEPVPPQGEAVEDEAAAGAAAEQVENTSVPATLTPAETAIADTPESETREMPPAPQPAVPEEPSQPGIMKLPARSILLAAGVIFSLMALVGALGTFLTRQQL